LAGPDAFIYGEIEAERQIQCLVWPSSTRLGSQERRIVEPKSSSAQGDMREHVFYIQMGSVKLSVVSKTGREAVVAMFGRTLAGTHRWTA
jgi:hypothetical protein